MTRDIPESDWKVFRELRDIALERFCKRVFDEIDRFRHDDSQTYHQRYIDLFQSLIDRDVEMARAFNNPRRSTMFLQLVMIHALGLVEPQELARFTPATREHVESRSKEELG
ncbi:MAG: hypothetical protein ACYS7Y_35355 [Planctomycetota bacterium]|jgi:hypothetical protein